MRKKEETKTVEKEKFNLEEACVMWKKTSKQGKEYLTGHDLNNNKLVGYVNDTKEDKLPRVRIYCLKEDNSMDKEVIVLWETESKAGKTYLSGYTDDKEQVIGEIELKIKKAQDYDKLAFKEDPSHVFVETLRN